MAKKYKIDLFNQVLPSLDQKSVKFYNNYTDEEKKEIQPLVLMQWLTGANNPKQIYFLNELVNPFVFPLQKHKGLLVNLLSICGTGKAANRYKYIRKQNKKSNASPKSISVLAEYFGYSKKQSRESLPLLTNEDIISFAEQLGLQKPELTAIKKELRTR